MEPSKSDSVVGPDKNSYQESDSSSSDSDSSATSSSDESDTITQHSRDRKSIIIFKLQSSENDGGKSRQKQTANEAEPESRKAGRDEPSAEKGSKDPQPRKISDGERPPDSSETQTVKDAENGPPNSVQSSGGLQIIPAPMNLSSNVQNEPGFEPNMTAARRKYLKKKEESRIICPEPGCGYRTISNHHLKRHRVIHTGERPYLCPICGYKAAQAHHVKTHMLRLHAGLKPYACEICGYRAARPNEVTAHMRKHTGEKPYACDVCEYRTTQAGALQRHKRTHTGETPYVCDRCGFKTKQSGNLDRHFMRAHTGRVRGRAPVINLTDDVVETQMTEDPGTEDSLKEGSAVESKE